MKVHRFDDEIQANVMRQMRAVTKSDYQRCFCHKKWLPEVLSSVAGTLE